MTEEVKEWLAKAEGDFNVALRENRVRKLPNYDAVCFHIQQCIEKLIKGILIDNNQEPPKIHDLVTLSNLVTKVYPLWNWDITQLSLLSSYAVMSRYPGEEATKEEANEALSIGKQLRNELLALLG